MNRRRPSLCELATLALILVLVGSPAAAAQEGGAEAADSVAADSLDQPLPVGPETYLVVDTIVVIEDREGLVWGDWYLNPSVRGQIERAFQVEGKLSGRTWLESGAPIQDISLDDPEDGMQAVCFVDKGVALDFWEPGEVDYNWVFEGPWGIRDRGLARADDDATVKVALPISSPPDRAALESRRRVGRLDVTYRPRDAGTRIPRGRFTIFLYYVSPSHGYRIAGVGY